MEVSSLTFSTKSGIPATVFTVEEALRAVKDIWTKHLGAPGLETSLPTVELVEVLLPGEKLKERNGYGVNWWW